jgi:hypothetical protein
MKPYADKKDLFTAVLFIIVSHSNQPDPSVKNDINICLVTQWIITEQYKECKEQTTNACNRSDENQNHGV